ncbi:MAG TPA: hypothetical protein VFB96_24665 [Pirellulaceae bacterium]|nr:hypothetical protein [Pirellulaceae bacterium]
MFWLVRSPLLAAGLLLALVSASQAADERTAADLLPGTVVAYGEVRETKRIIDTVLDHPLAAELKAHPNYQQALATPQYERFQAVVKAVEGKLGIPYRQAVSELVQGGIHIGFDLPTQGVIVLSKAADEKCAAKARDAALELVRAEAQRQGQGDPIKTDDHRDIPLYEIGEARIAVAGPWIIASNKPLLLRLTLNNFLAKDASLSDDDQFKKALASRPQNAAAWGYVDLRLLRDFGVLKKALSQKSDNPAIELIAGGVVGGLPTAPYVTAGVELDATGVRLTAALPSDVKAAAGKREFYLGKDGGGQAPPLLKPSETILSLATYRDFASMWRNAPDLFDEKVNAGIAQAESNLMTIFAGQNFRDDILGNLEPQMQLVVARQKWPQAGVTPAMKLPAVAVVMQMKNPEETTRIFKVTFQSVVGFLNVAGAQNRLAPLDLNMERSKDSLLVAAEYLPPKDEKVRVAAPPNFNASPTIVFVGNKVILSSAKPLALELAAGLDKQPAATPGVNSAIEADNQILQSILADNREPLIAQNMLEQGRDRAAAEKNIDLVLAILKHFDKSSLKLTTDGGKIELALDVRLKQSK